jgi:hypothetical protein
VRIGIRRTAWSAATISPASRTGTAAICGLSVAAALVMTAPSALADPQDPPPPLPAPVAQAAGGDPVAAPAGVPHLASPQNLPPGTTDAPVDPPQSRGLSYLRELWNAMQTQDINKKDALLLLTQRPLDPNAVPPPGLPPGPQQPLAPGPPPPTP